MNSINQYNNISFGQLVPTRPLLKCAINFAKYDDSKALCNAFDNRFPGSLGFRGKAERYLKDIENKNRELFIGINKIRSLERFQDKVVGIEKFVDKYGENIDIVW